MLRIRFVISLLVLIAMPRLSFGADDKFTAAESKFRLGDYAAAAKLATSVIETSDDPFEALRFRSACYEALRMFDKAIDDLDQCIQLKPKWWILYQRRGELHFKNGEIDESIQDFDHYLSGYPERVPSHWQRGISYYYAAQYAKGVDQFERHKAVNPQDVENAVWHFLCKSRVDGVDAARNALIEIERDGRPWAMSVYRLFQGRATPEQVIRNAEQVRSETLRIDSLFYAHLYVGLYYESLNQEQKALEQIRTAVEKYPSAHYMGDVARVHLQLRGDRDKKAPAKR